MSDLVAREKTITVPPANPTYIAAVLRDRAGGLWFRFGADGELVRVREAELRMVDTEGAETNLSVRTDDVSHG